VEGAKAGVVLTRMAQVHRLRDDIDNIQPGFDFINRSHN